MAPQETSGRWDRLAAVEREVAVLSERMDRVERVTEPLPVIADRLTEASRRMERRGASVALWLGVAAGVLSALSALGLWYSTARAQPDPQVLAQAVAAELKRGR